MKSFNKTFAAILIAIVMSGSISAQAPQKGMTPKAMDVSAFKSQILSKKQPAPKQNREYVTLLEEDFSLFTAGTEANPDTVNLVDIENGSHYINPDYTHMPGWMAYFIYQAGGVAYLGNGSYGFINTPEFEMSGAVHLSFRARLEEGNSMVAFLGLCSDPSFPQVIDQADITLTPEWQTFELDFYNPESIDVFIQINCYSKWFLDDFVISRELDFVPSPVALDADNYTMEGFDAHWTEVTTAEDYLLTVFKRDFYGPEQVYVEPESFEGINNNGQWIDYNNPNFPEGWTIDLQAGNTCHVTNDAHTGNVALCLDAVGDTIILPCNGGRFLESNIAVKILEFESGHDSDLEIIAKMNGNWHSTGVFFCSSMIYQNFGNEWLGENMLSMFLDNKYDEIGLAYTGEGVVWAIDDWDYTTTQACNVTILYEDLEIAAPALSYTVNGLNPADDHYYYVKARNTEFGESETSNYISCFGLCPPVIGEATEISEDGYTAHWEAHPKADVYEIYNYTVTNVNADLPNTLVFSEDFSLVQNGLEPQNYVFDDDPYYHRLDQYTAQPDWYGAGIILAEGMLGGAYNDIYYGRIYTPQITLNNAGTFHVKTTIWCMGGETVNIMATTTGETHSFAYAETGFQILEMDFTTGPESGRERLRFSNLYGYPYLIDNFQVMQDLHIGDKLYSIISWNLIEGGSTESYTFTGLNAYGTEDFAYDLIAIHNAFGTDYESVNSDYSEVMLPLGVKESPESEAVTVYPNPASERVIFSSEMETVMVYDIKGVLVLSLRQVSEVNVSKLPEGLYMMSLRDAEGRHFSREIVVKH